MDKQLCGVKVLTQQGREWICVKPVHVPVYQRHAKNSRRGQVVLSSNRSVDQHYFVRHYPYGGDH